MKKMITTLSVVSLLILAACSSAAPTAPISTPAGASQSIQNTPVQSQAQPTGPASAAPEGLVRTDNQGAVQFSVQPLNLDNPGDVLQFDLQLNTHSVDLSMNIASLATLTTDTGLVVQGTSWDAPGGGHHVEGKLSFPSTVNGEPLLKGAKHLTLTIKNVDASTRLFTWNLNK